MSKNMALRFIILVTFLTFQGLDCASFVEPSVDTIVTANQTKLQTIGVATFRWRYTVNSGDSGIKVDCRYYQGIDAIPVVKKASQTAPLTIENTALSSRIEIITDPNDNGVVSFKLNRVSKNDPRVFDCRLLFVRDGKANEAKSKKITLNVLDRPTFTNCLQNLQTVIAGSTINFKCIVTGNPRPSLRCQLLNLQGGVISSYPSGSAQAQNITQGSFTASKSASYISCFAEAKDTGYINKTTPITVYSSPFRIANISQIASSEGTSIRFQWKQLTFRESGNVQLQGYKVEWWVSSQFTEFENRTIRTLGLPGLPQNDIDYYTQNTYVYFEMRGLIQKDTYTFRVYGYNGYGDGTKSSTFDANPGFAGPHVDERSSDSSNIGMIIGIVIGSIVLLVIIVVLVVYCCRRSDANTRYPTSYVEDAVDYPPNQGYSMYAGVDKKQRTISRSDSTSGYPDVVGTDVPLKQKVSASYEPSNKAFV